MAPPLGQPYISSSLETALLFVESAMAARWRTTKLDVERDLFTALNDTRSKQTANSGIYHAQACECTHNQDAQKPFLSPAAAPATGRSSGEGKRQDEPGEADKTKLHLFKAVSPPPPNLYLSQVMARPDGEEGILLLEFHGNGDRSWQLNFDDFQVSPEHKEKKSPSKLHNCLGCLDK
ncbi:hypothetical protein Bca4012_029008 [Brassica carinata]